MLHAPYGPATFSAAYFDPEERTLYVLEDTRDTWKYDLAVLSE